jgi:hypothetical protein
VFNLDDAIAEWRQQMLAAGIKTPVPLEELESHLREAIAQHMKSGMNREEAFQSSVKKVGQADVLKTEFEKLGRANAVSRWRSIGIGCSIFATVLSTFLITLCLIEPKISPAFRMTDRLLAFAAIAISFFSITGWRYGHGVLPVLRNPLIRTMIGIICSVLGASGMVVYVVFVIPLQLQSSIKHFFVSLVWALAGMSILGGAGYGLETAAREQAALVDS